MVENASVFDFRGEAQPETFDSIQSRYPLPEQKSAINLFYTINLASNAIYCSSVGLPKPETASQPLDFFTSQSFRQFMNKLGINPHPTLTFRSDIKQRLLQDWSPVKKILNKRMEDLENQAQRSSLIRFSLAINIALGIIVLEPTLLKVFHEMEDSHLSLLHEMRDFAEPWPTNSMKIYRIQLSLGRLMNGLLEINQKDTIRLYNLTWSN